MVIVLFSVEGMGVGTSKLLRGHTVQNVSHLVQKEGLLNLTGFNDILCQAKVLGGHVPSAPMVPMLMEGN